MKKVLIAGLFLGLLASIIAAPLLVESYQGGQISFPADEDDTLTVADVSFSVDSTCYVQLAVGGIGQYLKLWFELDGERLPPETFQEMSRHAREMSVTMSYTHLLVPGEHTISLKLTNYYFGPGVSTICHDAYLQALIFMPDSGGAVAEQPEELEPTSNVITSVVSRGPYVDVAGATELVDVTGRVIENAIENDRVSINALPQGTYFARNKEQTIVKIVKVN